MKTDNLNRYYENIHGNKIKYELNGNIAPKNTHRSTKTHRGTKIQAKWKGGNTVEIKNYNSITESYEAFTYITIGKCEKNHATKSDWKQFLNEDWSNKEYIDWILGI